MAQRKSRRTSPANEPATLFKVYRTAAAEEEAAQRDAERARARWLTLAAKVEAGEPIDFIPDRISIGHLLRERADRVQVVAKPRKRGNPGFADNAIYDRALAAVQVEFLMRERNVSQEVAADRVAELLGRKDSTAVRKCHTELKEQASRYVDLLLEAERKGIARYVLDKP